MTLQIVASLIDTARGVIYDRHMFIAQATVLLRVTIINYTSGSFSKATGLCWKQSNYNRKKTLQTEHEQDIHGFKFHLNTLILQATELLILNHTHVSAMHPLTFWSIVISRLSDMSLHL